jgi:hypothetical protein
VTSLANKKGLSNFDTFPVPTRIPQTQKIAARSCKDPKRILQMRQYRICRLLSRFAILFGNRKLLITQKAAALHEEDLAVEAHHPRHRSMLLIKTILVALFISTTLASPSKRRGLQGSCPPTWYGADGSQCAVQGEICSYNYILFPEVNPKSGACTGTVLPGRNYQDVTTSEDEHTLISS